MMILLYVDDEHLFPFEASFFKVQYRTKNQNNACLFLKITQGARQANKEITHTCVNQIFSCFSIKC